VILLDSLLLGGIRFVLDQLATAVDRELNDDTFLRDQLLDAQMRLELGEITDEEFGRIEGDLLARLREIRERQRGSADAAVPADYRVMGVEATFLGDEHEPPEEER
jgi:hypothetical protein